MNDNAIQTALNATEEIDLTEFKLSKRTDNYGFTYVFEKKVSEHGNTFYTESILEEYCKIVRNTKVYNRWCSAWSIGRLVPVVNIKVCDYWNVNDGKPIHCTADVCRLTCTDNGKIVFTLEIHNLEIHMLKNVDEIPARKVNIVNLPTIRR